MSRIPLYLHSFSNLSFLSEQLRCFQYNSFCCLRSIQFSIKDGMKEMTLPQTKPFPQSDPLIPYQYLLICCLHYKLHYLPKQNIRFLQLSVHLKLFLHRSDPYYIHSPAHTKFHLHRLVFEKKFVMQTLRRTSCRQVHTYQAFSIIPCKPLFGK